MRKWLQITTKSEFKKTLTNSYKKNVDYIVTKQKIATGKGGHNNEIIKLTPTAAKKFCLRSKSKRGDDVRQYFIGIEHTLYKYKDYIVDGLNAKIEQLENNQKPKIHPNKGIINVFKALNTENTSLYKIGRSINSKSRFNAHNSPLANDLSIVLIHETENVKQVESCIKNFMKEAQYRKYKEIYQIDKEILKKTIERCEEFAKETNESVRDFNRKIKASDKLYAYIPEQS